MKTDLIVKLMTGMETGGIISRPFDPTLDHLEIYCNGSGNPTFIPFADICYIKFPGKPKRTNALDEREFCEGITTTSGEQFHLRFHRDDNSQRGFYGYPTDIEADFDKIYFTNRGIRERHIEQPIGELLQQQGLIDTNELTEALMDQSLLRSRLVGQIISEQAHIPKIEVEEALAHSKRQGLHNDAKVGEILIEAGLITRQQLNGALAEQGKGKRKRIGAILLEKGLISEEQLLGALAQKFNLRQVNLDQEEIDPAAVRRLSRETIERMQVLPIALNNRRLVIATSTPTDPTISESLRFATNAGIELVVASAGQIRKRIEKLFGRKEERIEELIDELTDEIDVVVEEESETEKVTETDSKVINLVNKVLINAYQNHVSDIHFEPGMGPQPMRIRYRKDGVCYTLNQVAGTFKAAIISRIKIIAKLDIAERRRPQTGKILLKHGSDRVEYRVEIVPTIGGQEDAVLRVLSSSQVLPLERIGFTDHNLETIRTLAHRPHGIILCVGPTGSGKTTTLHSLLSTINDNEKKIWTAEDPVEIVQEGMRQVQVHPKIGFTFEAALRSFLRSDPDVIMIGEMRDTETVKTAIGASLTGHLVFSTLHTNSAAETVVRLIEMGADPFNFSDAMLGVLAQRLVRKLCNKCKQPYNPSRFEYDELVALYGDAAGHPPLSAYTDDLFLMKAVGCPACEGKGYRGRTAIHELLVNSPAIRQVVKRGGGADELVEVAVAEGMTTLRQDGIQKIFQGITDLQQVSRVTA